MASRANRYARLLGGASITAILLGAVPAWAQGAPEGSTAVDEVIVTAQKREERIQDVPIAITALGPEQLDAQKIEGGYDLLRAVPNVTFSKSNYSGYNFSIRGVGTKAISATSDPAVAVAFNNNSLIRNRLFEQEYLDVERVEVLRGPQGTLYGRNATSGVINVITAKPKLGEFLGETELEVGNYDSQRAMGMINVPMSPSVSMRLAGAMTRRDGFGTNTYDGSDVDGRDLWTTRLSFGWEPTDSFRADIIWEHFEEDDNRLRTGKQLCHRDPGPESVPGYVGPLNAIQRGRLSQGCLPGSLYSKDAFQAPNGISIPFVAVGQLGFGYGSLTPNPPPFGPRVMLLKPGVDPYGVQQSRDLRTISSQFDAEYRAKADILAVTLAWDLTDHLTLTSQTAYNDDRVWSFQDYNRFATQPSFNDSTGTYNTIFGFPMDQPSFLAGLAPGGYYTDPQIGRSNTLAGFEISSSESQQTSQEFRLQSSFDGPLNFSAGVNYTKFKALNDYFLFFNVVSMIAQFYNQSSVIGQCNNICMEVDPNPIGQLNGNGHNYFRNKNPYQLTSKAAFGEVYWEASPDLKITAGLRYTNDRKVFTPWRSQLLVPGSAYGPSPVIAQRWEELSGRLGFDWHVVTPFTDDTMVYGFYSHGYKGGGANPPTAVPTATVFNTHPATFEPEFVDSFEIGAKNTLLGGSLILNGAAFYYDYKDYQVSKVVDRTIVNENFDATIWGLDLEAIWRPTETLRINATFGYLQTRIADGEQSIDIFDRTQGNPDWMVFSPWVQQTSNCILPTAVVDDILNAFVLPEPFTFLSPIFSACQDAYGLQNTNFYGVDLSQISEINNGAGFYDDLSGNELPNAPRWTFAIGAQYDFKLWEGWDGSLRGDYYRQADSWSRVYNRVGDRLEGWDNANLSLVVRKPADDLTFEVYVKNVFDKTPITDAFLNSDSTGMTTNVFTLDPRIVGVSVRKGF